MNKLLFFPFFFLGFGIWHLGLGIFAVAQAPEIGCLDVASNGDVTVSWNAPTDTCFVFSNYEIYFSQTLTGTYTLAGTTGSAQTNFTHSGANAQANILFYYVQTNSGCPNNESERIATMLPSVTVNSNGTNSVTWNSPRTPLLWASTGWYRIYREYPKGTWTLLDSLFQTLTYTDTFSVCTGDTARYRIEIDDTSGCTNGSVHTNLLPDKTAPGFVAIDTVSIDPLTGNALVSWNPSGEYDIAGYIVYLQNVNGGWDSIDYVTGNFYLNSTSDASSSQETYSVAGVDKCGNTGPIQNLSQHTIFLTVSLNTCNRENLLAWNSYSGWSQGVQEYSIYLNTGSGFQLLSSTTNSVFIHKNLDSEINYCYYIRATDGGGTKTSSSNQVCVFSTIPKIPSFCYIRNVTVSGSNIDLTFFVDTSAVVKSYLVLRSVDGITYTTTGNINPSLSTMVLFTDSIVNINKQSYYYKISVMDTCDKIVFTSNLARTIYLDATATDSLTNLLLWNNYIDWSGGLGEYNIYRSIDGSFSTLPVITINNGKVEYSDDVLGYGDTEGNFCYYIEAAEGTGNIYGFQEKSFSNISCLTQFPRFVVPNSFTPNGDTHNDVFKPLRIFIDTEDYLLMIYNKWGQKLFETTSITDGWDGTVRGRQAKSDVYVYYFNFRIRGGQLIEKSGTVTLLR